MRKPSEFSRGGNPARADRARLCPSARRLLGALFLGLLAGLTLAAERPLILLTNDDGVGAPGLEAVYRQFQDLGELVVVAPADNQSGISHRLGSHDPIYVKRYLIDGKEVGWSLKTTPAMCVLVALEHLLPRQPDLVLSGMNRGSNPGAISLISGTVAAARQASLRGVKAIALSLDIGPGMDYDAAAKAVRPLVERVLKTGLPDGVYLNVNAPGAADFSKGLRLTRDSGTELIFKYERVTTISGQDVIWVDGGLDPKKYPEDTDYGAMQAGYIAVSALTSDADAKIRLDRLARQLALPLR